MSKRFLPDDRKAQILDAALKVAARKGGWGSLTREAVAKEAGCSEALPSKYFGTMVNFRRSIMREAIRRADGDALYVIAQGCAAEDKVAKKAPADLKVKAFQAIVARG